MILCLEINIKSYRNKCVGLTGGENTNERHQIPFSLSVTWNNTKRGKI